jgi:Transcriptional regulator, AbiEi antitoxin, Type IV TA system
VQQGRDQWRLTQKRKLLDLWVGGYNARLRPNLLIGRYQPPEADLEQTLLTLRNELEDKKISWALTGGFAADILTRHFRGQQLSFFADEWPRDLMQRLRWLPSADGPVTVLRKFSPLVTFDSGVPDSPPVAHPLLVYAELIFQGRERELETTKILYDRYLASLIQEDGP